MSVKGLVLDERAYLGSVTPPDAFEDKSGRGNDGVHTDITWVKNPQGIWVRGFNGEDSKVSHSTITFTAAEKWSINLWMKEDATGVFNNFSGDSVDLRWTLAFRNNNNLNIYDSAADRTAIINNANRTSWTMITVTYDNGSIYGYLNTTSSSEISVSTTMRFNVLGAANGTVDKTDGLIVFYNIRNYALSPEEIAAYYQATKHWFNK